MNSASILEKDRAPSGQRARQQQHRHQETQTRSGVRRQPALILDLALAGMRTYAGLRSLPLETRERLLADQGVVLVYHLLGRDAQRRRHRVAAADVHHHQQQIAEAHLLHHVRSYAVVVRVHVVHVERGVAQVQIHLCRSVNNVSMLKNEGN